MTTEARATESSNGPGALPETLPTPGRGAIVGFSLVAAFLLVFAVPPLASSVLFVPALLAFLAGVVVLAIAPGPRGARYAWLVLGAYVLIVFALFAASSSVTLGKQRVYVNPEPSQAVEDAYFTVLNAFPAVLMGGSAAAMWPWSGRWGRSLAGGALVLLLVFLGSTVSTPSDVDAGATRAAVEMALLTLASLALLAATALVIWRDRLPERYQ